MPYGCLRTYAQKVSRPVSIVTTAMRIKGHAYFKKKMPSRIIEARDNGGLDNRGSTVTHLGEDTVYELYNMYVQSTKINV